MAVQPSRLFQRAAWLRFAKRVAASLARAFVAVTLVSLIFNALTPLPRTLPAPDGRYIEVNGIRVHYQEWGLRGTPIVLVHGFLESTVSWDQVAPLLARDHRVYALDLAGYGYTQYDGKYSLADEERLVDGFLHVLRLRKPILVGHSLGAAVVGDVALLHPSDVGGIIFADGDALPLQPPGGRTLRSLLADSPYFTTVYRIAFDAHVLDRLVFKSICGPDCPAATSQLVQLWLRPLHQAGAENALKTMIENGVIGITPQQVAAITVPRAIIWGQFDKTDGGSLRGAIANLHHPETKIIAGAGHLSMVAKPSAFAAAVETESSSWQ